MKRLRFFALSIIFLLFGWNGLFAQTTISQGEYFFDADPGLGGGTMFSFSSVTNPDMELSISVSELSTGFHSLYLRFKDSNGRWGLSQSRLFFSYAVSQNQGNDLLAAEYFFDTDPGVENGQGLPLASNGDFMGAIDLGNLESDFHILNIRYKNSLGIWGIGQSRMFYVEKVNLTVEKSIASLEYFIDSDPGVGLGFSLTLNENKEFIGGIDLEGIESGFHNLYTRYKDSEGKWGIAQYRQFYISPVSNETMFVDSIEYFFDEVDPGVGQASPIELLAPSFEIDLEALIAATDLESGVHTLNIRIRNTEGVWSQIETREFTIESGEDLIPPVVDIVDLPELVTQCIINVEDLAIPTATDDVDGTIIGITNQNFPISLQGNYSIIWTFTDAAGNSVTQEQMVIVDDTTAPVPNVAELPVASGQCSVTAIAPTANDACGGTITGTTTDPMTYDTQGTFTIIWNYDDGNGNTATQIQTVIVDDTTAPVPTLETLPTITGECSVEVTAPTANDACEGTITGTTEGPISYTEQGTYLITWTYHDGNGNASIQEQTVIVDDTTAPVPDISELPILEEQCVITLISPTATDNCGGTIIGTTNSPMTLTGQGYYSITWNYTDQSGNETTQIQEVYLQNIGNPEIYEQGKTFTDECRVELDIPVAFDQCAGEIVGITNDPLIYTAPGTYEVEWIFDDGNGNQSIDIQYVEITGSGIIPTVENLPDVLGDCSVTVSIPTAVISCSGETIHGSTSDPLTYTLNGTYVINWSFEDGNGNTLTQEQTVIIDDTAAPIPDVASLPTLTGNCLLEIRDYPTATDNCSGMIRAEPDQSPLFTAAGEYTITWTYDDRKGNVSQQTQLVIMETDTQPFWITEPGALDRTLNCPTEEEIQASFYEVGPQPGSLCYPVYIQPAGAPVFQPTGSDGSGVYLFTWYYRTPPGIRIDYTVRITVNYGGLPTPIVSELPVITGECEVEVTTIPSATSCSGVELIATTSDPLLYNSQGTYTITWTYTDGAGNTSSQDQTVIIDDTISPEIQAPENVTITLNSGETVATEVQLGSPTTSDNCNEVTVSNNAPLSYSIGSTEIIWTATDENGNQSSAIQTVLVNAPSCGIQINAQPSVTLILNNKNSATLGVNQVNLGSSSTCGNVSFSLSQTEFNCSDVGVNEVLFTVTDVNGNVASEIVLVTVQDVTLPKFAGLPKSIKISLNEGVHYVIHDFSSFVTDNCGIASYSQSIPAGTPITTAGVYDVVIIAADASENSVSATVSIIRTVPKAKGGKTKRLIPGDQLLISVPWNTSFDEVVADIETEEGILIGWKDEGYDPLTPGLYQITPVMTPQIEFRYKDVMVTVAVEDKPKALDIELSSNTVPNQPKAGDQVAILSTIDPVDDIHTYRIEGDSNLAVEGDKLIWNGDGVPAAQMKVTVFSTDRTGQAISKEVTLNRDILPNEFLLYPNPAGSETNVKVSLNEGATVEIQLFDASGRLIGSETAFHEETFVKTFNLDGLAPGLYTVQVKIGWLVMTKRLIKQ